MDQSIWMFHEVVFTKLVNISICRFTIHIYSVVQYTSSSYFIEIYFLLFIQLSLISHLKSIIIFLDKKFITQSIHLEIGWMTNKMWNIKIVSHLLKSTLKNKLFVFFLFLVTIYMLSNIQLLYERKNKLCKHCVSS